MNLDAGSLESVHSEDNVICTDYSRVVVTPNAPEPVTL